MVMVRAGVGVNIRVKVSFSVPLEVLVHCVGLPA